MISDRSCPKTDGLRPRTILAFKFNWNRHGSIGYRVGKPIGFSNKNTLGFLGFRFKFNLQMPGHKVTTHVHNEK